MQDIRMILKSALFFLLAATALSARSVAIDIPVSQDMEELVRNGKIRDDGALNLGYDWRGKQLVGLRFEKVSIPHGARIDSAYLELTAKRPERGDVRFRITVEESGDAAVLSRSRYDLSRRSYADVESIWNISQRWIRNRSYRTGDIAPLIEELVMGDTWRKGHALLLLIEAESDCSRPWRCRRTAKAGRASRGGARLHIEYTVPSSKKKREAEAVAENWYIRIVAEDPARGFKELSAQLGELEGEDVAEKHSLKAMSPFGKGYLDVVFKDPQGIEKGEYKSNFHSITEDEDRWSFTVKTDDSDARIILSWRGIYVLDPYTDESQRARYHEKRSLSNPLGSGMKLIDSDTGEEVAAYADGKAQVYIFSMNGSGERHFEWVLDRSQVVVPVASADNDEESGSQSGEERRDDEDESTSKSEPSSQKIGHSRLRKMNHRIAADRAKFKRKMRRMEAHILRLDARAMRARIREERKKLFDIDTPPEAESMIKNGRKGKKAEKRARNRHREQ